MGWDRYEDTSRDEYGIVCYEDGFDNYGNECEDNYVSPYAND
jgi:hypothetical protein